MDTVKQAKINLICAQRGKLVARLAAHDLKRPGILGHINTLDAKLASLKSSDCIKE
jgi:hypothetical protein